MGSISHNCFHQASLFSYQYAVQHISSTGSSQTKVCALQQRSAAPSAELMGVCCLPLTTAGYSKQRSDSF